MKIMIIGSNEIGRTALAAAIHHPQIQVITPQEAKEKTIKRAIELQESKEYLITKSVFFKPPLTRAERRKKARLNTMY